MSGTPWELENPRCCPRGWGAVPSRPQDSPLPARVSAPGPSARGVPSMFRGVGPPEVGVSAEGEGSREPPMLPRAGVRAQGRGTLLTGLDISVEQPSPQKGGGSYQQVHVCRHSGATGRRFLVELRRGGLSNPEFTFLGVR